MFTWTTVRLGTPGTCGTLERFQKQNCCIGENGISQPGG